MFFFYHNYFFVISRIAVIRYSYIFPDVRYNAAVLHQNGQFAVITYFIKHPLPRPKPEVGLFQSRRPFAATERYVSTRHYMCTVSRLAPKFDTHQFPGQLA